MTFYFTIFFIFCFLSLIEYFGLNRNVTLILFIGATLCLFTLSFIRWETGTDWANYLSYFDNTSELIQGDTYETGYAFLNGVVKLVFDNYTILLAILGCILFAFQNSAIWRMSPYPLMSLFFLWAISFANILFVRQWVAIAILFWSIRFIEQKRFWPFFAAVIFGFLLHRTAILFLLAWWIYKLRIKPRTAIIFLIGSIAMSIVLSMLLNLLGTLFGGIIEAKISMYLSEDYNDMQAEKISLATIIIKGFANKIFILLSALFLLPKIETHNDRFRGYVNLYWFSAILYFVTISISLALVRFSYPFDMLQIIIVPLMFKEAKSLSTRFSVFLILTFYLALRHYLMINSSYMEEFVPYRTILNTNF